MSNFDVYKWNRERHLIEARLNEEKSKHDLYLDMFIQELEGFDGGAADYLKSHRNLMIRNMQSIDFDFLDKPSLEEGEGTTLNLSQDDMDKLHKDGKLELDGHKILYKVNEEISDYEMVVYKVEGVTAEPYEGGPDEPFEMEIKLDASLSDDEVKDAIRDAARREQGKLYKLDYKKA